MKKKKLKIADNLSYRPLIRDDVIQLDTIDGDINIVGDIDSLVMSCTSLEPFLCDTLFKFNTGAGSISRCETKKLIEYLNKRDDIFPSASENRSNIIVVESESVQANRPWFEFELGYLDDMPLFVVF